MKKRNVKFAKVSLRSASNQLDWPLLILVLFLTAFGVIMIGNVSVAQAFRDFNDRLYYLKLQGRWAFFGLLTMLILSRLDYQLLKRISVPLMLFTIFSLFLVLIPGVGVQVFGARRWLALGGIKFQPAELAKLSLVLYLATLMSKKKRAMPFLVLLGILLSLIMLEPDLGTALIVSATGMVVYLASGAPLLLFFILSLLGIFGGAGLILSSNYRRQRLMTFLNPAQDPLGASYHIRQILIALGSGGMTGLGLGQSRQKHEFLPAVSTDSIFAVIGEELGFVGAASIILLFLFLVYRGFKIAKEAPDEYSRLLAAGITAWIGIQALINLAAMVALVPLTGVPLPFISYGGSSLVLVLAGIGILLSISRHRVVKK